MSCIVSLGEHGVWKVKNSLYGDFVSLLLTRPLTPAAAEVLQMSEYVNGLDYDRLVADDAGLAEEIASNMVRVSMEIASGEVSVGDSSLPPSVIQQSFSRLARLLQQSPFVAEDEANG